MSLPKYSHQIGVGCVDITDKEKNYVMAVLDSGRLSYGPFHRKFEEMFAVLHGCRFAMKVNSGTSALRLAVAALKELGNWNEGDEVICPAVTFIATSNVVIMNGLTPVFVDVSPKTYNIDPAHIERAITKKTRAIMAVHLFGQPADMDPIMKIAKKHDLKVIEDSCETMFVKYKGRPVGSIGDISCFSTYAAHLVVTGVGGITCTNHPAYARVLKSLANHGRDGIYTSIDDDKNLDQQGLFSVVSRRFRFERLGYSFRSTEMEAALGVAQLERYKTILSRRQANAARLIRGLTPFKKYIQLPWHPALVGHAFMMFPIVIRKKSGIKKSDLVMFLEEHNIETRDMLPLTNQPVYKKLFGDDIEHRYPVAKWVNENGFYIGSHQKMTPDEIRYIIRACKEFFGKAQASS